MKPLKHVQYIVSRATKRLYVIRRLKAAGVNDSDLIFIYISLIRSILETACPVFQSQLTVENKDNIERIQKIVLKIILGSRYESYSEACLLLELQPLEERRVKLCLSFGLKCLAHPTHSTLFTKAPPPTHDIRYPAPYLVPQFKTTRYNKTPVPYITRLLNDHLTSNEQTQ